MADVDVALSLSGVHHFVTSTEVTNRLAAVRRRYSLTRRVLTAVILSLLNLVNFFDRSIYGVVLTHIKKSFDISNSQAGLLQTVYVISIIVAAPFAGVIGRKFSRKWAIIFGSIAWCAAVIAGPLAHGGSFTIFCCIRACAGLGESFLGTLAVTIFADLFNERFRPLILNIFMGGILLGGSLAYMLGPLITERMAGVWGLDGWVWVTSGTGVVGAVFLVPAAFIVPDIPVQEPPAMKKPSMKEDIKYLIGCKTYLLTLVGYTCFSFTLGSKQYWSVTFLTYSSQVNDSIDLDQVITIIAVIVLICGWLGAIGTAEAARLLKNRGFQRAQPIITGVIGMFSGLTFFGFMLSILYSVPLSMLFFGLTNITLSCWVGTTQDILMSVLPPFARPIGAGIATLTAHLLGDGFSSLIIGGLSDWYSHGKENTYWTSYTALTVAFFLAEGICTLGGAMYVMAALFLPGDLEAAKKFSKKKTVAEQHTEGDSTGEGGGDKGVHVMSRVGYSKSKSNSRSTDPFVPLDTFGRDYSSSGQEHSLKR